MYDWSEWMNFDWQTLIEICTNEEKEKKLVCAAKFVSTKRVSVEYEIELIAKLGVALDCSLIKLS